VYIRRTLALTEKNTGVRPRGWSSPSVFPNADTFTATAAGGIRYSLDGMDSDVLSRLVTKSGTLVLSRQSRNQRGDSIIRRCQSC
jgi:allantoinase